ncbi:hypothetical protein PTKIN_Ptkin09bG0113000 [Pterospermum kingtungense]
MLSSATSNHQFPELTNGMICCTVNTEDLEIPCNEDIVFSKQLCPLAVSSTENIFKEAGNPLSACVKDFSAGQKTSEGGSLLVQRDKKDPGQSHGSSQIKGSQMIPEMGQLNPVVKARICSADSLVDKPALCSDSHNSYPLVNFSAIKQEVEAPETIKEHQDSAAAVASMDVISPEPVADHPPPDLEELLIESDDDVPCFSDIEATILDMDFDPDDQDFVIRKILLGRTTEDLIVDINLGRERCANKVSSRQAIISMEEDGSFHLKNLGKCSVSINSKEVAPGQSQSLTSSCLIEIRGMPFIFKTNQTCVKRYLNGVS